MSSAPRPPQPAATPTPGEIVAVHAVQYTYLDDTARLAEHRPAHRAFLRGLHEQGVVVVSGPLDEGSAALLILEAESPEAAIAALEEDPFRREGLIVETTARAWTVVIGELPGA